MAPAGSNSRFGQMFLGLAGLMLLSAPFGHWPGGSLTLIFAWVPNVMLFLMGAQVLTHTENVRRGLYVLAASSAFIATMTIIFGGESLGRLRLSTGDLGNPNDLATVMLFCLPGWLLLWHRKESVVFSRLLAAVGISACVLCALRTGSALRVTCALGNVPCHFLSFIAAQEGVGGGLRLCADNRWHSNASWSGQGKISSHAGLRPGRP